MKSGKTKTELCAPRERDSSNSKKGGLGLDGRPSADPWRRAGFLHGFLLAPLLVITIAIAGLVLGQEAAQGQIFDQLRILIGAASADAVQDVVQNANTKPATGILTTIYRSPGIAIWCIGRFRPVADLAERHMGRGTQAGSRSVGDRSRPHSLLWLYPCGWLPAARFPSSHCGYRVCGRVAGWNVSGDRNSSSDRKFDTVAGGNHFTVRDDLQVHARCEDCLARCLDRRFHHGSPFHGWKACPRSVPWKKRRWLLGLVRRDRSLCCCYGSTTRHRSSFSGQSSRAHTQIDSARALFLLTMRFQHTKMRRRNAGKFSRVRRFTIAVEKVARHREFRSSRAKPMHEIPETGKGFAALSGSRACSVTGRALLIGKPHD